VGAASAGAAPTLHLDRERSVSTTTAPAPPIPQPRGAVTPRLMAAFAGTTGYAVKLALLSLSNALAAWAAYVLVTHHHWIAVAVLAAATLVIDYLYLGQRTVPAKFLIPGTIFLLGFQVIPIIYTVDVAFTNYSTGHVITKADAVKQIKLNSLQPPPNGKTYTMAVAHDAGGKLVLILRDDATGKDYLGTTSALTPLPAGTVKASAGQITAAKGYTLLHGLELFNLDKQLQTFVVPVGENAGVRPQGLSSAVELEPTLRYDARRDAFVQISNGTVFSDNGKGEYANGANALEPGWKTGVGTANFSRIIHDPLVRQPFIRVFVWTFVFAAGTVFSSFALGLFLAIALDKKGLRFQRFYRSVLVIPYAIPGFLSILVWSGLLNDQFGLVNRLFHTSIPWLFDANWAKVSCILVSAWLTVPYFFLVSMGALQSIPEELTEAARVDGGGPLQIFRRVTLPLLLVAVGPLLVSSFAFNFNNFNTIYFLTSGGPPQSNSSIAGSTDILISYTYKLAIAAGKGQDFALASAMTIIIFFITAALSTIGFARTRVLATAE
jgi:arabinogalactan oligomer/maltooligosaccharide transport system permease protein